MHVYQFNCLLVFFLIFFNRFIIRFLNKHILVKMGKKNEKPEHLDEEDKTYSAEDFPKTAPRDARFPNTNCSYWCFQMFRDYHRCIQLFDKGHTPCDQFKNIYLSICPNAWVEKWESQLENGTFPATLPNDCHKHKYYKYSYAL